MLLDGSNSLRLRALFIAAYAESRTALKASVGMQPISNSLARVPRRGCLADAKKYLEQIVSGRRRVRSIHIRDGVDGNRYGLAVVRNNLVHDNGVVERLAAVGRP